MRAWWARPIFVTTQKLDILLLARVLSYSTATVGIYRPEVQSSVTWYHQLFIRTTPTPRVPRTVASLLSLSTLALVHSVSSVSEIATLVSETQCTVSVTADLLEAAVTQCVLPHHANVPVLAWPLVLQHTLWTTWGEVQCVVADSV